MTKDIYFEENYGKLYEQEENGQTETFRYEDENGIITNQFIKRTIPIYIGKQYYDITTPYGYGGPIIEECKKDKAKLVNNYARAFLKYCDDNDIISEFIRFHPIFNNALDFNNVYDVICLRKTLGTNLETYEDPITSEFSKSCRKNIRQCKNKGISFKVTEKPTSIEIEKFKNIYYATMDRNGASDFYYFKDEYFKKVLKYFSNNIITVEAIYEGNTIAMGLYFIYNKILHIHLSGTLTEYLYLSPAYMLRYGATLWAKENGYKLIHHGGGRSNSKDDSLYLFKKGFAQNTEFDFYIGKKIWNKEIYDKLCEEKHVKKEETEFFPAYRKDKNR